MRTVFVHLHIPKCGGMSVLDVLARNFGSTLYNVNSIFPNKYYNSHKLHASLITNILVSYPRVRCLTGHRMSLDLPFNDKRFDIQAFTWVRDPVERFISHYFYHRARTNLVPETKTMGLLEYTDWALKQNKVPSYVNGQVNFLCNGLRGDKLRRIEDLITSKKLFLFPVSRLQDSFYTLAHKFPNSFTDVKVKTLNSTKRDIGSLHEFREMVSPYVEEDFELLRLALQTYKENGPVNIVNSNRLRFNLTKMSYHTSRWMRRVMDAPCN